jgi:hypothetical protein
MHIDVPPTGDNGIIRVEIPTDRDACLMMPDTIVADAVNVVGGRNVRLIGGHIVSATTRYNGCREEVPYDCPTTALKTALRLTDFTGSFVVEGTHIDVNANEADAIHIRGGENIHKNRDVFLRNVFVEGYLGISAGTHADTFHTQGFVRNISVEYLSSRAGQNSFVIYRADDHGAYGDVFVRKYDIGPDPRFASGELDCWIEDIPDYGRGCRVNACFQCGDTVPVTHIEDVYCTGAFIANGDRLGPDDHPEIHDYPHPDGGFVDPGTVGLHYRPEHDPCACGE